MAGERLLATHGGLQPHRRDRAGVDQTAAAGALPVISNDATAPFIADKSTLYFLSSQTVAMRYPSTHKPDQSDQ